MSTHLLSEEEQHAVVQHARHCKACLGALELMQTDKHLLAKATNALIPKIRISTMLDLMEVHSKAKSSSKIDEDAVELFDALKETYRTFKQDYLQRLNKTQVDQAIDLFESNIKPDLPNVFTA